MYRRSSAFVSAVNHLVGEERDITSDVNRGQGSGLGHPLLLGYPVPVVMDGRMEGRGPHGKPRIRMLENVQIPYGTVKRAPWYESCIHSFIHFIRLKKNTLTILHNPQIAKLIEAGCAFKSNVIISKNETKIKKNNNEKVNTYNEIIIISRTVFLNCFFWQLAYLGWQTIPNSGAERVVEFMLLVKTRILNIKITRKRRPSFIGMNQ